MVFTKLCSNDLKEYMDVIIIKKNSLKDYPELVNRNKFGYAKELANILGGKVIDYEDYIGKLPKNALIMPHVPITVTEYKQFGSPNLRLFFGGVVPDRIFTTKSITHQTLPDAINIPLSFPHTLASRLKPYTLPGYTVFSIQQVRRAYKLLTNEGYVVRAKKAFGSRGIGQTVLRSEKDLTILIAKHSNSRQRKTLQEYGLILEANVVNTLNRKILPTSYGVAKYSICGKTYSRLGVITYIDFLGEQIQEGTKSYIVKGSFQNLQSQLRKINLDYYEPVKSAIKISKIIDSYGVKCTRLNINLIEGVIETRSNQRQKSRLYFVEPTFRMGGSTGVEILAVTEFMNNKCNVVKCEFGALYGKEVKKDLPPGSTTFYTGKDRDGFDVKYWGKVGAIS